MFYSDPNLCLHRMSRFRRWSDKSRSDESGFERRFRNSLKSTPPLKPTLEIAVRSVRSQLYKLDMLLKKLREKDGKLLQRISMKMQKHDDKHAAIFANELVEIRKMMRMVAQARYALEAIALRIETVRDLGDVVVALAPAVAAVKNVQKGVAGVIPAAEDRFTEITGLLSDLLVDAGQTGEVKLDFKLANEDAEKILAEASVLAEKNLKQKIPEIPSDIPEPISTALEEALA